MLCRQGVPAHLMLNVIPTWRAYTAIREYFYILTATKELIPENDQNFYQRGQKISSEPLNFHKEKGYSQG